jgi:mandelamide amidase
VNLSALAVARAFAAGELSAEQHCAALLAASQARPDLCAWTWQDADAVLAQARAADLARARNEPLGLLAGVPIAVKDNIDTLGVATSAGNALLRANLPTANAAVWARLAAQGAIPLGKTNMHELAAGATSRNPVFGNVVNPVCPDRIAGGSSGGTAAVVAAGLAPAGLGTDTSGSVRTPASFCGIAGLRPGTLPSRKWPAAGVVPLVAVLDTAGPMARDVADLALLHTAVTGEVLPATPAPRTVILGVPRMPFWDDIHPDVAAACDQALERIASAGVRLVEVDLRSLLREVTTLQQTVGLLGRRRDLQAYLRVRLPQQDFDAFLNGIQSSDVHALYSEPPPREESDLQLRHRANVLVALVIDVLRQRGASAMVYPCVPVPAPTVLLAEREDGQMPLRGRLVPISATIARHARFAAGLGLPALTLPVGRTREGAPVGLEIAGLPQSDAQVLAIGILVEALLR